MDLTTSTINLSDKPHRLAELEEENLRLELELRAAVVRRELAEKLPRLGRRTESPAEPAATEKKTKLRARKRHRQRLQQRTNQDRP